ncbi:H(+)/Cl(-) exchange transporter ClcA [Xanthobacter tagetidis]|uniref:H(+)/Cl(-) exchange transporter ClcA n=1 Tax=Xanthobacter tagetidis TaxID=60216 RepID=UPI0017F6CF7E|nr:H(+)/Cl(-) exchange transporter ClcA [Xanthobacter tagetidis]MBB6307758.1 CIC family chloride channel protein [Xanthobacter tagetidis]
MSPSDPSPPAELPQSRAGDALFYLVAIGVGAITGVLGTALHLGVDRALQWPGLLRDHLGPGVDQAQFLLLSGLIAAVLVLVSVWMVRTFAPEAGGSGVQEIEGAMEGLRTVRWWRVLPVKFFGGFLSLGSGLVLGREGPTIHMGASVAQAASEGLKLPTRENRGLLAAGAAAGLAAAFSAPLASILFVIEETRRQFPYGLKTYTGVMLASVTSGIVTQAIAGPRPFMAMTVPAMPLEFLPAFVLLGVVLGFLGVAFNRCLVWSMDLARGIGLRTSFYLVPAVVGFAVGVLLVLRPEATMGGETLAVLLVAENLPLATMAVIVLIRFAMTMASYSTGVPGGIFAPILAMATAFGLLFALCLELALPLPPGAAAALAVAAMGGLFSATIRAPLVGVVLLAELTGAYTVLVPVLLTCLFANFVADWLGGRPIYEVLLERTLRLDGQSRAPSPSAAEPQIGGWDQR